MTIEHKTTYCRICESLCGMVAEVEGDRLLALRADRDHPLSAGFACQKASRSPKWSTTRPGDDAVAQTP